MNNTILTKLLSCTIRCTANKPLTTTTIRWWSSKVNIYNMNFDRRIKVDYKDSIEYMKSEAFAKNYQGFLIWQAYRRNHKLWKPAKNARPDCVNQDGFISTSYPCPICRDEYLVVHPENAELIKQFVDPTTDKIYDTVKTGVCQKQQKRLIVAHLQAKDTGKVTYTVPHRLYDYNEYNPDHQAVKE